ncbi:MAG TPA: TonB-dependent receptor, partial [Thermoanaerobaculia bacterium]|nr:TonB-dependent receptor [Thermoanaerobaculia bacterium]
LFIEDAIQETTVMTGGISAEFGRFTGGVVNSITKSGGNEFSGSFRDSLTNPAWEEASDYPGDEKDESTLNEVYEATLGGRIIRDRLWFFAAGRFFETSEVSNFTYGSGGPSVVNDTEQLRYELKLTGAITPRHNLWVSYLDSPLTSTNNVQLGVWEQAGADPEIEQGNDFLTARYNGIITNNLLFEVGYAKKTFTFIGFGGENPDLFAGTPLVQWAGFRGVANAPYFCGSCGDELRDNENWIFKTTYYLGTSSFGTHNLVAGYDDWMETRQSNNYQSPTNYTVWIYGVPASRNSAGVPVFTVTPGVDTVEYFPVEFPSLGSDLTTRSIFLNDKWDLNQNFSFNIGARWDQNDAKDSFGQTVADDSFISPRVGMTYDPFGNGRVRFNANYGTYVGRLAEGVAGAGSPAGSPHFFLYYYGGPEFTGTSREVVTQVMNWFNGAGGIEGLSPDFVDIGGVSTRILGSLKSPNMKEWTVGAGFQVGSRGYFRADYIDRDWDDYYVNITNMETGQVTEPRTGNVFDFTQVTNSDLLDRTYQAIQMSAQYRALNWLDLGANYTWSELRGNAEGEGTAGGPSRTGEWVFTYPEYHGFDQNAPTGFLSGDQTHKLRAWASSTFPLGPAGNLNVSLLHRWNSGQPISETALIRLRAVPAQGPQNPSGWAGITNPGYETPPVTSTYFFSERGEFRLEDLHATDLALNYSFPIGRIQLFVQGEVFNLLNNQEVVNEFFGASRVVNTTVHTWATTTAARCQNGTARCAVFDPFNETPQRDVHFARDAGFGEPLSEAAFQEPRTYQFSAGIRF